MPLLFVLKLSLQTHGVSHLWLCWAQLHHKDHHLPDSNAPHSEKWRLTVLSISSFTVTLPTYNVRLSKLKDPTPPISFLYSRYLSRPKQSIVASTSSFSVGILCHMAHLGPCEHIPRAKWRQKYDWGLSDPAVVPASRSILQRNLGRVLHGSANSTLA